MDKCVYLYNNKSYSFGDQGDHDTSINITFLLGKYIIYGTSIPSDVEVGQTCIDKEL